MSFRFLSNFCRGKPQFYTWAMDNQNRIEYTFLMLTLSWYIILAIISFQLSVRIWSPSQFSSSWCHVLYSTYGNVHSRSGSGSATPAKRCPGPGTDLNTLWLSDWSEESVVLQILLHHHSRLPLLHTPYSILPWPAVSLLFWMGHVWWGVQGL